MTDKNKTQSQLISELEELRRRVFELEAAGIGRDTERKPAEDEPAGLEEGLEILARIRTEKRELASLFDLTTDMICTADVSWCIRSLNKAWETVLGYSKEELLSQPFIDFVHPDDVASTIAEGSRLSPGQTSYFENRYRCKDGTYKWLAWSYTPSPDTGIIFAVARDISEKKQMEDALRAARDDLEVMVETRTAELTEANRRLQKEILERHQAEQRWRGLVETTGDWIWEADQKGQYTYVSPRVKDILGYEPDEIVGKKLSFLMPPDEAADFAVAFGDAVRSQGPIGTRQNITLHKNGREVVLESNSVPVVDDQGALLGYRGIDRDVTERKKAVEELRQLRNYLTNIIDSMPSVLVGVDAAGRVTQWNAEAQTVSGVPADRALGRPMDRVFPRLAAEMDGVREAMRTREVHSEVRRARYENGKIFFEDITIYPLTADGAEGAVIQLDDVTERVRLEEMMVQSEKMLSVGGLAAGMAHEINNPLAGMMLTASVVRDRLTSPDMPANKSAAESVGTSMAAITAFMEKRGIIKMLERICESGSRAAEIVSNMLSFARKSDSSFHSQNIAALLDRCIDLAGSDYDLRKKLDFRQIEIQREYEENVPSVLCDGGKIQQVLLNVLRNGAEVMQQGSGQAVRGKPRFVLRLAHERQEGWLRIEIEDNGPGMDEETRKRVFEPFFTTKPTDQGTGLGLSVSYFIISETHGGEMSVESTLGVGTKFIIRLPLEGNHE